MIARDIVDTEAPRWEIEGSIQSLRTLLDQREDPGASCKVAAVKKGAFVGFVDKAGPLTRDRLALVMSATAQAKVLVHEHFYSIARVCVDYLSFPVAVVDKGDQFIGSIGAEALVQAMGKMLSLQEAGVVVTLSAEQRNFSLQEIMYLLDSEGVKLWNLHVVPRREEETHTLRITLHLHPTERLSVLLATFERFGYGVTTYEKATLNDAKAHKNFEMLMRYLNT